MDGEQKSEDPPRRIGGLEVHIVDEQIIVYEANSDRVHFLSPSAAMVLELCNGKHSVAEIVSLVGEMYALADAPLREVNDALIQLKGAGLIH